MDPLTAIRPFAAAQFSPAQMPASPPVIPLREIQELPESGFIKPTAYAELPGSSFENFLGQMVNDVNAKQAAAGQAVTGLMSGQGVPLHQAIIAMEEASVSFQLMVEVRNKMVESYQELMRMQI